MTTSVCYMRVLDDQVNQTDGTKVMMSDDQMVEYVYQQLAIQPLQVLRPLLSASVGHMKRR